MKAIILARISTKEQRDGHSLDAQKRNLEQYAERKKLEVIRSYALVESSTKKQRPEFDLMIAFIKKQRGKTALIVDTVDRLQRSFRETPIFNDLMERGILELHFVKEGNVLSKDANSTQKLMWNMGVVMAQSYTDQLSDNVKRSFDFKVKNGEWCAKAPLGYINVTDTYTKKAMIIPDKNTAQFVRRIFVEYATGIYSIAELARMAADWGLRSKQGYKIGKQYLHAMIQNPFYYGVMCVKGEYYAHKYEPLVSKDVFDRCQEIRKGRSQRQTMKKSKYPYLYRGFFKCAVSGRQVTCDLKKGRYIYMLCNDPARPTKRIHIREEHVSEQIERKLKALRLPSKYVPELIEYVKGSFTSENKHHRHIIEELTKEREDLEAQIDKLTDLIMRDGISQFAYDRKHAQLQKRYSDVTVLLNERCDNQNLLEDSLIMLILLSNNALSVFKSSKMLEKRLLLKTVFSNFYLNGGNAQLQTVIPLSLVPKTRTLESWQCL